MKQYQALCRRELRSDAKKILRSKAVLSIPKNAFKSCSKGCPKNSKKKITKAKTNVKCFEESTKSHFTNSNQIVPHFELKSKTKSNKKTKRDSIQRKGSRKLESQSQEPKSRNPARKPTDDYCSEIIEHFLQNEIDYKPKSMKFNQHFRQNEHFLYLMTLRTMNEKLYFKIETLYSAINIFNLVCSMVEQNSEAQYRLLTISSLLIACKNEEIAIPQMHIFCLLETQRQIVEADIARMQTKILLVLDFKIITITPFSYVSHFLSTVPLSFPQYTQLETLCEQSYFAPRLATAAASLVATACVEVICPEIDYQLIADQTKCSSEYRSVYLIAKMMSQTWRR